MQHVLTLFAAVQTADSTSSGEDAQDKQFLAAIVLAYFASQNRSLLAADCLIETVVEIYRRGIQLDSLQFTLSMATLQSGSTLLSEQGLDILTARCGIIMLTLQEIGCSLYSQVTLRHHRHSSSTPKAISDMKQSTYVTGSSALSLHAVLQLYRWEILGLHCLVRRLHVE